MENINPDDIKQILTKIHPHLPITKISSTLLPKDASLRYYLRINYQTGKTAQSKVAMILGTPQLSSDLPFITMQNIFKKNDLLVPQLYYYLRKKGIVLLEDLGDISFEEAIQKKGDKEIFLYYTRAIDTLIDMQKKMEKDKTAAAVNPAFTHGKFMEELIFFVTYISKYFKITPDKKILFHCFSSLCDVLINEAYCFTHRDYHSRNIMVKKGNLFIIDFQDARMGPWMYDIASLLRDSYVVLPDKMRKGLYLYYLENRNGPTKGDLLRLNKRSFDYMCIQRNLKALGTFAYQKVEKNNSRYLQYIPDTLNYVKENCKKYVAFKPVLSLIDTIT